MQQLPLLILVLLLVAWLASALSRHPVTHTDTLDVAASLSRARAAVSTDALPLHQSLASTDAVHEPAHPTTSARLTLHLHSHAFLPSEQGRRTSYKSLVLARLRHDSAHAAASSACAVTLV